MRDLAKKSPEEIAIQKAIDERPRAVSEQGFIGEAEMEFISSIRTLMVQYQEQGHPYTFRYIELYRIIQGLMQENDALRERIDSAAALIIDKHLRFAMSEMKRYRGAMPLL